MINTASSNQAVHSIFWPTHHRLLKNTLLVLIGAFILAVASQLSIPLTPVPLTFQSATVVLIGMMLGARLGLAAVMTYLVVGTLGMPVFAQFSAGPQILMGMNGGYLLGFIPAVLMSGYLAQRGWAKNYISGFIAALIGVSFIFAAGVTQLAAFLGWHAAWVAGVKPFIFTELLKLVIVALAAKQVWRHS
ncbi:MAG: biotin transporter BioY [Gammaproteobacteria bacterium]